MNQIKVGQCLYGICVTEGGVPGEKWHKVGEIIPYIVDRLAGIECGNVHVRHKDKEYGSHLVTLMNADDQRGFYLSKFELLIKQKLGLI